MKILFLITQSERGGAQRWVRDTALELKNRGYEVGVAVGGKGEFLQSVNNIKFIQLKHLVRPINPLKDLLAFFEIFKILRKEKPDILQLVSTKAGFLGSIAGKISKISKIIYRIGGWSFNDPRPKWQNLIFKWMEKFSVRFKDKIIVNSKKDYQTALDLNIAPINKLTVLYNGIRLCPKPDVRLGRTSGFGQRRIITVANFYKTKGLEYLIEAANLIEVGLRSSLSEVRLQSDLTFSIIGDGQERPYLESLINKYNLQEKVFLLGSKINPEAELGKFDIFVLPSVKEGMPYALLEAMAAGLPVIATAVGGIPEIIEHKKNGILIPAKNVEALTQAIINLINNPSFADSLGREAVKTVEKKFSFGKMIENYLFLLNRPTV